MEGLAITVTIIFSCMTALFSFLAYKHTKERFRLDLLDKRWEIYKHVLEFCSVVLTNGGIPKNTDDPKKNEDAKKIFISAYESIRGMGLHKSRSLFGQDVLDKLEELNDIYSWLVSFERGDVDDYAKQWGEHMKGINKTIRELPDLFKPYVYFGDYKSKK